MFTSDQKEKLNNVFRRVVCLGISVFMVGLVYRRAGIYFETNDDRFISEILSGVYGGEPEAHTVYVNYLLSLVLAALYKITIRIPWYGGMLLLFHVLVYTAIMESLLELCKTKFQILTVVGMEMALFLQGLYMISKIQYTSTAALMAIGGYACLLLQYKNRRRGYFLFVLFSLLSCLLRRDAMLMIQPLGLAASAGVILAAKNGSIREKAVEMLKIIGCVAGCLLIAELGTAIGYHSEEWREYNRYNEARTEIFDYYGKPDYEEIADILAKYDVSRAEYEAFKEYVILNGNLNVDCTEEIAAYVKKQHVFPTPGQMMDSYMDAMWEHNAWKSNRIAVVTFAAVCILLLLYRQYRYLVPMALIKLASVVIWGYLIYRGRLLNRIILPLYIGETEIYLSVLVVALLMAEDRALWRKAVILAAAGIFCILCFQSGRQQYRFVHSQNEGMEQFMPGFWEINAYCEQHPENKYLLDAVSMSYYTGDVLETRFNGERNNIVSGTWFSGSPVMRKALQRYFEDESNGFQWISYDFAYADGHPAIKYLQEKTGVDGVLTDQLVASHGGGYLVYYFARGLDLHEK